MADRDILPKLDTDDRVPAAHSEASLRVLDHKDFVHLARAIDNRGMVEGTEYRAALTSGDGTCALHAAFGAPSAGSGRIYCSQVRSLVSAALPNTLAELQASHNSYLYPAAEAILDSAWSDLILPAARSIVLDAVPIFSGEANCFWQELQPEAQEEIKNFTETKAVEQNQKDMIERKLHAFYAELFVPQNEQPIIRRLCCRLRYLTEESIDYLQCTAGSIDALAYEGNAGALQLLHATADDLCVSKYQALFRNEEHFQIYRRAFFSALHSDLILRTLLELSEEFSSDSNLVNLLQNGYKLLKQRADCFGCERMPPNMTKNLLLAERARDTIHYCLVRLPRSRLCKCRRFR